MEPGFCYAPEELVPNILLLEMYLTSYQYLRKHPDRAGNLKIGYTDVSDLRDTVVAGLRADLQSALTI